MHNYYTTTEDYGSHQGDFMHVGLPVLMCICKDDYTQRSAHLSVIAVTLLRETTLWYPNQREKSWPTRKIFSVMTDTEQVYRLHRMSCLKPRLHNEKWKLVIKSKCNHQIRVYTKRTQLSKESALLVRSG